MIDIRKAKYAKSGLEDLCGTVTGGNQELTMLEIGSFVGNSTLIFLQYFNKIYCVDPWSEEIDKDGIYEKFGQSNIEKQFDETVYFPNRNRITKIKDLSENVVSNYSDEAFDFVYIDGDHSYEGVLNDIERWFPKVKKGGFIGGHDYNNPPHPGVQKAVDDFFHRSADQVFKDTSWIVYKK